MLASNKIYITFADVNIDAELKHNRIMERKFKTYKDELNAKTDEYVRENLKLAKESKDYAYTQAKYVREFPQMNTGMYAEPDMCKKKFNGLDIEEAFTLGACWKEKELMDMVCEWIYNHQSDADIPNIEKYVSDLIKDMGVQQYKNE